MKKLLRFGLLLMLIGLSGCADPQSSISADPKPIPTEIRTSDSVKNAMVTPNPFPGMINGQNEMAETRQFKNAPDLNLFNLTRELVIGTDNVAGRVTNVVEPSIGHTEDFWLVNLAEHKTYKSKFSLELVTPHANWFVEEGLDIAPSDLLRSANHFEKSIYPMVTHIFGTEWIPGIDNDHRLNIVNAKLIGVAGYFNSADEYPTEVRPLSNQREIIYVNALIVAPGSTDYNLVIAHELQHIIHWNADPSEDTWVNEGLSELSSSIALGSTSSISRFLSGPPVSLINWPVFEVSSMNFYGAASLFFHFLTEHYGGHKDLKFLLAQPGDGIDGIDEYLKLRGYEPRFNDVFREWSAANILDIYVETGDDIPAYENLEIKASVTESISGLNDKRLEMPQYSVEYTELKSIKEPFLLSFKGQTTTRLIPVDVEHPGCWWSNTGDSIDSTLSRRIELPVGSPAFFEYEVWFETEKDWDYVYVEVSTDGGINWQITNPLKTNSENPFGNGFGAGYTGKSGGWLKDKVDLAPFAKEDLWIRFQYVTDAAINASGACFRNLYIPGGRIDNDFDGWEAKGFIFTNNEVRQNFQVQLLTVGDGPHIQQMTLDANNSGSLKVPPPKDGEQLILAVGSLAEKTRESASYTISLTPVK